MQSTENDDKVTPAEKLQRWLDFAEANRPGHDSLRSVSYEPAPVRQAWLADVLVALAAERDRADRAELLIRDAPHESWCASNDWGDDLHPDEAPPCDCWKSEATA